MMRYTLLTSLPVRGRYYVRRSQFSLSLSSLLRIDICISLVLIAIATFYARLRVYILL